MIQLIVLNRRVYIDRIFDKLWPPSVLYEDFFCEKTFRKLGNMNQIWILITLLRFMWPQTGFRCYESTVVKYRKTISNCLRVYSARVQYYSWVSLYSNWVELACLLLCLEHSACSCFTSAEIIYATFHATVCSSRWYEPVANLSSAQLCI